MPREIKHRGFVPDQETWITGNLIGNNVIVGEIVDFNDEYFTTEFWQKVDPESVGQYTGIKDKNGKEIFEGDILATDLSRPYLIVEFRNGAFVYQCHDNGQDYHDFMKPLDTESDQDEYLLVIGNIYEHPELLES